MLVTRLVLVVSLLLSVFNAFAVDLELTQGVRRALPIAVIPFQSTDEKEYAQLLSSVITADLKSSGLFKAVSFDVSLHHPSSAIDTDFLYWRKTGVNNMVVGKVMLAADGRLYVAMQLLDPVSKAHVLLSKEYKIDKVNARALAHHISDLVYQQLTGDKGIFSTRLAFIKVKREKDKKPSYTLSIADVDGFNSRVLLSSSEPIMSPSWSPDGKHLAYVSFENKRAEIYTVNVATGARVRLTDYAGINGAPTWSPDGKKLAVVLSKSGEPNIYLVDISTKKLSQLTFSRSIDTEPEFSPDGQSLIFTSGRGGSPQLYRMDLASKQTSRVTFDGNYNAQGRLTPDNKHLVLLHRSNKKFIIGVQPLDTGEFMPLTFTGQDESPSIAPNGKMVVYATKVAGKGVIRKVSIDGRVRLNLPLGNDDIKEPAWSPFLG